MAINNDIFSDIRDDTEHPYKLKSDLEPTEDPESDCFGCEAGMCSSNLCRGDQYYWNVEFHDYSDYKYDF